MTVSLVITTYNRPDFLALVLDAVAAQRRQPDEVIVADDGSGPETAATVREKTAPIAARVRHLRQDDMGFRAARARNMAIAAAGGEYIVFLDGDTVPARDFIADHALAARPGCFVQGTRTLMDARATAALTSRGWRQPGPFSPGMANRKNAVRCPRLAMALLRPTSSLHGIRTCNFACWRSDAIRVNGFNEDFHGWGREDSEFAARLLNAGVRRLNLRFMAGAFHLHHDDAPRKRLAANDAILEDTVRNRKTRCERGVNLHMRGDVNGHG